MEETKKVITTNAMPTLALRGLVAYPNVAMHFDVKREKSILAIKAAMDLDRKIFIVTQKNVETEEPEKDDLYKTGVVCTIKQLLKHENDTVRVLVEGEFKAEVKTYLATKPFLLAEVKKVNPTKKKQYSEDEASALIRLVKNLFKEYCFSLPNVPQEIVSKVLSQKEPQDLLEKTFPALLISYRDKQKLMEEKNIYTALENLAEILEKECTLLDIEHEIYEKVKGKMDKNQRDYYLREQQKVIAQELNDGDDPEFEALEFIEKISSIKNISEDGREKLIKECNRLSKVPYQSQEGSVIRSYIEICLDLPWDKSTKETINIEKAEKQLNADHFGLTQVKEKILEIISVRKLNPDIKGQIICLVGPPGVGKTSIASSVAKALNRKFQRISLGGISDESEIRGHRKTYLGSMPGRVISAFRQAKSNNPLILFDEIDKLSRDYKGDPASALLEVLDGEQNSTFVDHYIDIDFDLSKALFITTANSISTIPAPLLDRMDVIEVSSYTREEKFMIAKNHLIKKQLKKHGLTSKQLTFKDSGIYEIIDCYTKEAGVRTLERRIASVCSKAAKLIVSGNNEKINITDKNIEEFLDIRRYKKQAKKSENIVGCVNGLAWTSVGGEMLEIECAILKGTGKVKLTGSLGDVMKESADIAISYARLVADEYNIDKNFYKENDIHIHAPEGAVPKDGPSAGVTMTTALISALSNIPVRGDVAMTGEISLRGKVLPIGGLREKSMAAYREGKKVVIIPKDNEPDLRKIDKVVLDSITFIPVDNIKDVLDIALVYKKSKINTELLDNWCDTDFNKHETITTITTKTF